MMKKYSKRLRGSVMLIAVLLTTSVLAASGAKIDRESDKALQVFREDISGAEVFIQQAAGYLVFPRVIKVGIGVGAETGEGVLRVGGQSVAYYRTTSGSIGLQFGAQAKSIVIAFMTKESLQKFRNSDGWKVGVGICEDIWSDSLTEKQAALTVDVWLNLNASPFHIDKQIEREALMSERAKRFNAPVVYVNPVGGQDEVVFDGGSHVMDTAGELLLRAPLFDVVLSIVDLEQAGQSSVAHLPPAIAQVHDALVLGVRDYVRRNRCETVVMGLSGGIDSAVTAAIAVEALGAANVLGVLLPSKFSSEHSISDAEALVSNLGIKSVIFPISAPVGAVEAELSEAFSAWGMSEPDVTEENIQARVRGVLLMAVCNKSGRMLLTTGNKSEMAVGYATLYGDMAGGFAVLKDVYKTDVFALANYMNREDEVVPQNSIDKPPSAELRPDQKDSDSLPDYDELDAILKATIEDRLSVDEIAAQGFNRDEVKRVVGMLHAAEYKRRQSPPGVKITCHAFGRDRRYPITHAFHEV
jgi:NAD+ synthase (glutamine-hydrolysing)